MEARKDGRMSEKARTVIFDRITFTKWMEKNKDKLADRFGQNPDTIIVDDPTTNTVDITELIDSKTRKASVIDTIENETEEE